MDSPLHLALPIPVFLLPAGQAVQFAAPRALNVPLGQLSQTEAPAVLLNCPGEHCVHVAASPPAETCPGWHLEQVLAPIDIRPKPWLHSARLVGRGRTTVSMRLE